MAGAGEGEMVLVGFRNVMWAGGGRSRFVLTRMFRVGFLQHIVVLIYGRSLCPRVFPCLFDVNRGGPSQEFAQGLNIRGYFNLRVCRVSSGGRGLNRGQQHRRGKKGGRGREQRVGAVE